MDDDIWVCWRIEIEKKRNSAIKLSQSVHFHGTNTHSLSMKFISAMEKGKRGREGENDSIDELVN